MLDFLGDLRRTQMCGALRASDAGKKAVLMGWVNRRRDLGNLIFVDLRDRTGVMQVVINAERDAAIHEKTEALRNEYVIAVTGTVKLRDASTVNKNIATGEVELVAEELRILNESKLPPFLPSDTALTNEETRLKYRYIDLRREAMQFNIELRHKVALAIRNYLAAQGFFEIETPFMTRSTPEGARDYLVPSRVQPGTFYALPQSPQLFKQILMISGFDKYFQIVRCFRDEDLRADRQPEFTQIDLEMTYPQPERVWEVVEGFLTAAFAAAGFAIKAPFPRMDYDEAIRLYGIDKPDLRLPAMTDVRACFPAENLQELAINPNLPVLAIRTPKVGELSRKERDDIKPMFHSKGGAKIFEDFKRIGNKFPAAAAAIAKKTGMEDGDLIVLVGGSAQAGAAQAGSAQPGSGRSGPPAASSERRKVTPQELAIYASAGLLRLALAHKYAERHGIFKKSGDAAKDFRFLWVTNFPMFEWDEGDKRWNAAHHPFTSPHEEDMPKLEAGVESLNDPLSPLSAVRALAYDVVLNGTELGSGSIRIHRQDVQSRIFRALGMTEEEARARFGFFLEALEYGTPPHGGIALGLDRIVMIIAGAESLREVIPFPKTARAVDLMVDAPTPVSEAQLRELGIQVVARDRQAHVDTVGAVQQCGRRFVDSLKRVLAKQRGSVAFDAYDPLADEVVGGLFARNVRLSESFLIDFHMWADDVGQSLLRMMFETLIYLKFLLSESKAEHFIEFRKYGIGQEKLYKMQLRRMLEEGKLKDTKDIREFIDSDSDDEIFDELVNVRLDNFENLRVLAEKSGMKDEYALHYQPYSVVAHGHWPSLRRYYLQACGEPLHKFHMQPSFQLPGLNFSLLPECLDILSSSYDLWTSRYGLDDLLSPEAESYLAELGSIFRRREEKRDA